MILVYKLSQKESLTVLVEYNLTLLMHVHMCQYLNVIFINIQLTKLTALFIKKHKLSLFMNVHWNKKYLLK